MSRKEQDERGERLLWAALDDFYGASKHKCDGITATGKEVLSIAREKTLKLKLCEKVTKCLLSMDVLLPALDQMMMHPRLGKPSMLIWGCISYLFKVANRSRVYNLAMMFSDICDILDDGRLRHTTLRHSSRLLTFADVRAKIPALFSSILACGARAIEKIGKKRERIRFIIPSRMTKPFVNTYALAVAELRSHRDSFVSALQNEARRAEALLPRSISTATFTTAEARPSSYRSAQTVAQLPSSRPLEKIDRRMKALISSLPDSLDVERDQAIEAFMRSTYSPFGTRVQSNKALALSSPEYKAALQKSSEAHHAAKFLWIQKQRAYIQWTLSRGSTRCLWIYGDPGTGKTPLAARIIQNVEVQIGDRAPRDGKRLALGFFFISSASPSPSGQDVTDLLKKLATQFQILLGGNSQKKELHRACVDYIKRLERLYVVVDGLDQAHNPTKLTEALLELYNDVYPLVKLLVLSKKTVDIQKALGRADEIEMLQ